jgi:hypothetical protein
VLLAIVTVIGTKDHFHISLEDEVVRGSIVVQNGQLLWPPPPPPTPAPGASTAAAPKQTAEKPVAVEPNYFANTLKDALLYTGGNVSHLTQGYNFSCTLCPVLSSLRLNILLALLVSLLVCFLWKVHNSD